MISLGYDTDLSIDLDLCMFINIEDDINEKSSPILENYNQD